MAPLIEREPGSGPYQFLAQSVTSNKNKIASGDSIFLECPELKGDTSFHTYGAGDTFKPDYYKDIEEFGKYEYVYLIYEESQFTEGKFRLSRVEPAQVTEPEGYDMIDNEDMPIRCPQCGEETHAIMQESGIATAFDEENVCHPSPERLRWISIHQDRVFVH